MTWVQGKLRMLYECYPMAFLMEQVGTCCLLAAADLGAMSVCVCSVAAACCYCLCVWLCV